jgi:hypothetical protein
MGAVSLPVIGVLAARVVATHDYRQLRAHLHDDPVTERRTTCRPHPPFSEQPQPCIEADAAQGDHHPNPGE